MKRIYLFFLTLLLAACQPMTMKTVEAQVAQTPTPVPPTAAPAPVDETVAAPITTPGPAENWFRQAWFYKPPENSDLQTLAANFQVFILTKQDEEQRDELLRLGVKPPILQYLLANAVEATKDCSRQPFRNQVADQPGDYCDLSTNHPDWFLRDSSGRLVRSDDGSSTYLMDMANPGWQAYWLQRACQSQELLGWQGVFLDNLEGGLGKRQVTGAMPAGYANDAAYQESVLSFLKYISENYFRPTGRPLYANLVYLSDPAVLERYLVYLDGVMVENFATNWRGHNFSAAEWETQMELVERAQQLGKTVILVSQGDQNDTRRQEFALGSYLLVNQGRAAFRYANHSAYEQVWLYEDTLNLPGTPLAPRYREGNLWKRNFTGGTVTVDPVHRTAAIRLNQ